MGIFSVFQIWGERGQVQCTASPASPPASLSHLAPSRLSPLPHQVHALLADMRADARKRHVLLPAPPSPNASITASAEGARLLQLGTGATGYPDSDYLVIKKPANSAEGPMEQAKEEGERDRLARSADRTDAPQPSAERDGGTGDTSKPTYAGPAEPSNKKPEPAAPLTQPPTTSSPPGEVADRGGAAGPTGSPYKMSPGPGGDGKLGRGGEAFAGKRSPFDPSGAHLDADPLPVGVSPPPKQQYKPTLGTDVPLVDTGDLAARMGDGGDDKPGTASDTATGKPVNPNRPPRVHELPEVVGKQYSMALPPQLTSHPIMVGPGSTVVAGPGSTVVAVDGATVMRRAADPALDMVPTVSQRPYNMGLDARTAATLSQVQQPEGGSQAGRGGDTKPGDKNKGGEENKGAKTSGDNGKGAGVDKGGDTSGAYKAGGDGGSNGGDIKAAAMGGNTASSGPAPSQPQPLQPSP